MNAGGPAEPESDQSYKTTVKGRIKLPAFRDTADASMTDVNMRTKNGA
jgi:hypothetical protein